MSTQQQIYNYDNFSNGKNIPSIKQTNENHHHYDTTIVKSSSSSSSSLVTTNNLSSLSTITNHHNRTNLEDFIYELKQRNVDEERHTNEEFCDQDHQIKIEQAIQQHLQSSSGDILNDHQMEQQQFVYNGNDDGHQINGHHQPSDQQNSSLTNNTFNDNTTNALLARLAKKEKDLILAAELGKALLDRNEELSRTNEQLNEEYTRNIELLEQEKYALRKKLNSIEIEYENKIHDLQADLKSTKENLNVHVEINKQNEAESSRIITELSEQNRRLTLELKETSNRETLLEKEIQSLKEQYSARRTNFSDHIGQLEGLRDEINLLSNRKRELENKISSLNEEKLSISITLDESQYKILSLEKQLYEKELSMQNQQKDLEELRRMNIHYQNKIDSLMKTKSSFDMINGHGAGGGHQVSSLYNEIEISSHSSFDENNHHHHHHHHHHFSEEDIDMITPENYSISCHRCFKSKQEIGDLYQKLKQLYDDLLKRRSQMDVSMAINSSSSSSSSTSSSTSSTTMATATTTNVVPNVHVSSSSNSNNHDSGIQTTMTLIDELNMMVCDIQDLIKNIDLMQCLSCQQFNLERNELERLQKKSQQDKEEIVRLNSQMMKYSSDATIQEAELNALKERNKILEEDTANMNNDLSQDEIVKRALKMRDETIARKKAVEIELAKVRIELMHVNSQLLETIQQKVELSQQLEQWQVDMEILIEEQLKNKLSLQEKKSSTYQNGINGHSQNGNPGKKDNLFNRISFSKLLSYQRSSS